MQMIENTLNNEAFNFLRTEHELGYVALASIISAE
jgi:secreted Zn-dependent insulinase-like peptidase